MAWTDKRPMSPHLQVYRLPLTAKLSVLHRGTGLLLFFAAILLVGVLFAAVSGPAEWQTMQQLLANPVGKLFLLGILFSLFYHLCNGIRHLFWDIGKGLSLEAANRSGIAVMIASLLLTSLTWVVA